VADRLPSPFDAGQLRRRAKELRAAAAGGDLVARERVRRSHPRLGPARLTDADLDGFTLRDAQLCVARELGFDGWAAVLAHAQGTAVKRPLRRWPDRPSNGLTARCMAVSDEVGTAHIGPEHALGALLRPPRRSAAVEVLEALGTSWARWSHDMAGRHGGDAPPGGARFNPAWYGFIGFAEGLALADGSGEVTDEHALLALAYRRDSRQPGALDSLDVDPEEVVRELARRGVAVSELRPAPVAAPAQPFGDKVHFAFEDFSLVMEALAERYPPGAARWGWNTDGRGRYWVSGERELAIEEVVRSVVRRSDFVVVEPVEEGHGGVPGR
jgi:hypothetical protein